MGQSAYIAEIAGADKYDKYMQVLWIFIQASQVLGNFIGGYCMIAQESLTRYLTSMLLLSGFGIFLFFALPSMSFIMSSQSAQSPQSPTISIANSREAHETPIRADTIYSNTPYYSQRVGTDDNLVEGGDEVADANRQKLPFCKVMLARI